MAGVLVFGDAAGGRLRPASLDLAGAGQELSAALGAPLLGALVGASAADAERFLDGGFATVYLADDPALAPYTGDAHLAAAEAIVRACEPSVVLLPHTRNHCEWAPRLALRLDTGLVTDCVALRLEAGELVMVKPLYGGGLSGEFVVRGAPAMATVRARAYAAPAPRSVGRVVRVPVPPLAPRTVVVEEGADVSTAGPSLSEAKIVVSGGRGIGGPESWHQVEALAALLGGAVGASRAVIDAGWVPGPLQVGVTGVAVSADLYIAIGISGAPEHVGGITGARAIVAINSDPEASIFRHARFGVVGDFREVLPAFTQRLRELRAGGEPA